MRARGIICPLSMALRFHPNCWHGPTAAKVPAMVSAVVIDRVLVGIHRTYLAEPGVKAFGEDSKLMLGRCAGGAVRLSDGPGPLLVAEKASRRASASCRASRTLTHASGRRSLLAVLPG